MRVPSHLTAGVRDAVVFGAGVELGIDHVVRRSCTAASAPTWSSTRLAPPMRSARSGSSPIERRGVDGLTVAVVERLLAVR
jgi:hypothetical protein